MTPNQYTKRRGRTRTRRLALAAVAALSALAAVAPGAANAGSYPMYHCRVPGHETGNHGPWTNTTAFGSPGTTFWTSCSSPGGGFGPYAGSYLGVDSRTNLTLAKDNANISIAALKLYFHGYTAIAPSYSPGPITTTLWADGAKVTEWTGGQSFNYSAAPYELDANHDVTLSLACAGSGSGCMPNGGYPLTVDGVQVDLSENVAPNAAISGGSLTAGGGLSGTKTVTVQGTDPDSGVRKFEVLLDGVAVGSIDYARDWTRPLSEQPAGTCAYDSWIACPPSQAPSFNVNTKLVPDGTYALSARVTDAAGNVTATAPQAVSIDNVPDAGAPIAPVLVAPAGRDGANGPSGATGATGDTGATGAGGQLVLHLNGRNATAAASLKAVFAASSRATIRSAYGKKVLMTGRLQTPGGQPIAGAKVQVLEQDKQIGAVMQPVGEVTTDAAGTFVYTTTALRSRTIRFAYRTHVEDATFAQTSDVGLEVIAKISLRTNKRSLRNGQAVTFSGAVAGAPTNARKVVELQVKKGSRWMTFRTTRLRAGRFHSKYRFTATHGVRTYAFRARVRAEAGFPFSTGVSNRAEVTVRG